jgi:hypothetical protein
MIMNIFLISFLFLLLIVVIYFYSIRPRILTWGATKEEATQIMLGDDIVQKPHFIAT